MPQSAFAITVKFPDIKAILAALHAGGPDLRMKQAGQGAVAQLCTEDGNPVVSLEAPRYIQVPGETARLLGDVVHRDGPLWWTEVRASTAVPEAQRLAASIAGRLAALLDVSACCRSWGRRTASRCRMCRPCFLGRTGQCFSSDSRLQRSLM